MYYIIYVHRGIEFSIGQGEFSSILAAIEAARDFIPTYWDGTFARICQRLEDKQYQIGIVTQDLKWTRSTYKMYNRFEDSSSSSYYTSQWKASEINYSRFNKDENFRKYYTAKKNALGLNSSDWREVLTYLQMRKMEKRTYHVYDPFL